MKYDLHVCRALLALLILAACGTPDRSHTAAQPTPRQTAELVVDATPPGGPAIVKTPVQPPMPSAKPSS